MEQEHQALAESFGELVASLEAQEVSWQAGITTMDMTSTEAGWLVGSPYVITNANADQFTTLLELGTEGTGPEAGFASAQLALELAVSGPNIGFRRDDAALHVIFVSDTDDQSEKWLGDDPSGVFLNVLASHSMGGKPYANTSAIAGDVPGGCASVDGTATAGTQYDGVVRETSGLMLSICSDDFEDLLGAIAAASLVYERSFELSRVPSGETSITVTMDAERIEEGWMYSATDNSILFETAPVAGATLLVEYLVLVTE